MSKNWVNTENDDAHKRIREYWNEIHLDLEEGEFWAEKINEYKDEPKKRLSIALHNLPLPAAFREAAISTRAIIRAKRKANEEFENELKLLYWLAAIRSFMLNYAPRLEEPGYNVVESIPGQKLRSLPYDYSQLGFKKLSLLNKTDVKWLIELWGEPASHKTLNDIHRDFWNKHESKLIAERKREDKRQQAEWDQYLSAKQENKGCSVLLLVFLILIILMLW